MSFYTYILQSETSGKLYIGQTNNIENRLHRHNTNQNKWTKGKGPWILLHAKQFETRSEAVLLERKLKSWKSPAAVKKWILAQSD